MTLTPEQEEKKVSSLKHIKLQQEGLSLAAQVLDNLQKGGLWAPGPGKLLFDAFRKSLNYFIEFHNFCDWERLLEDPLITKEELSKKFMDERARFDRIYYKEMEGLEQ